jgi:hypothetical protein
MRLAFKQHPLRETVTAELHLRTYPASPSFW